MKKVAQVKNDVLDKVLEAEQEIQAALADEKENIQSMLDAVRSEAEACIAEEEARLKTWLEAEISAAESRAEAEARAIVDSAAKKAERIGGIDDDTISRIIYEYIRRILPGK